MHDPTIDDVAKSTISWGLRRLSEAIHTNAKSKGFWDEGRPCHDIGHQAALIHSEVSEFYEAWRTEAPQADLEEELADIVIRVLDLAQGQGFDVIGAIFLKHAKNLGRPYMHGKRS